MGPVHVVEQVPRSVVINQRRGLILVGGQSLPDGRFVVVGALKEFPAVSVTDALLLRRVEIHVINFSANRTGSPAGQALQQNTLVHA